MRVVQGGLCHGSRDEKLMYHESRIFKFYSEALHVHAKYVRHGSLRIFFLNHVFGI